MKLRVAVLTLVLLLGIVLAGCDSPQPAANTAVPPGPPPPPGAPPPPLPPETKVGVFAGGIDDLAAGSVTPAAQSATATPPADPDVERVKAQAGVGAKGRSLDQYQGYQGAIVTPARAFFAAKERIVFEAQFKHQYDLYKAMEGSVPRDFSDLKAKVLDPYQIKLPPLPQGHRYVWDAATEELQVERPKQQ